MTIQSKEPYEERDIKVRGTTIIIEDGTHKYGEVSSNLLKCGIVIRDVWEDCGIRILSVPQPT